MMTTDTPQTIPLPLQRLQKKLDQWRQTKTYQAAPIPEHLWHQAIQLADQFSPNLVARTLRLNYERVRTRLAQYVAQKDHEPEQHLAEPISSNQQSQSPVSKQRPTFLEFNGADTGTAPCAQQMVVQVSHHDGSRMSLQLPKVDGEDLGALIAAFLARRP